jgi:type I restriction enzyme R subunit
MKPEDEARSEIDRQLTQCGWIVQDQASMNIMAGPGVAVREFKLKSGHGRADYLLYPEGKVTGVMARRLARACHFTDPIDLSDAS